MPVYLVSWELSGCIPVEAATEEEAKRLAEYAWKDELWSLTSYDVDFSKPKKVQCLEEAYEVDPTLAEFDGDVYVDGSDKPLRELLPSNPNYAQEQKAKWKQLEAAAKKAKGEKAK